MKARLLYEFKQSYDNETGKGGHRHLGDEESPYVFVSVEALVADFLADVEQRRPK